jgi:hypothetical protein
MPFSFVNSSSPLWRACGAVAIIQAALLEIAGHATSAIAESVEIRVPLNADGAYEVDKLLDQCNRKLGSQYPIERYRGRKQVLSPGERAALLLANELGFVDAQISSDLITLKLHAADDPQRRQEVRQRLARWLKVPEDYWTADHGLQIPKDFDPARRTLLVIHGLEATHADLEPFARACRATNIQLLTFSYPNDGPLAPAGKRLHQELHELARKHPRLRVAVVGLSMGGLVGRYAFEAIGTEACGMTDLFLIGTPNQGSALVVESGFLELVYQMLPGGMKGFSASFADGLGEAADDLEPGSEFLASLNALPRAAGVRYHVGIGTRSYLNAEQHHLVRCSKRLKIYRR